MDLFGAPNDEEEQDEESHYLKRVATDDGAQKPVDIRIAFCVYFN